MKKLASLISAFIICAAMAVPVVSSADGDANDSVPESTIVSEKIITNSSVECTNNVKSSYTVTIPDGKADISRPVEFRVSATNVIIGKNQTLNISVKSVNNWRLLNTATKDEEEEENREYIDYELVPTSSIVTKPLYNEDGTKKDENEDITENIENGVVLTNEDNNVLTINSKEACDIKITKVLTAKITGNAKVAGVYKDTLTFTVEVNGELETDEVTASGNKEGDITETEKDVKPE